MANPKSLEALQSYIDKNPFKGFNICDNSILNSLKGRKPCPQCGKSRKFYCYSCFVSLDELKGFLPGVKLPIKVDIIKHKHEIDGKSTAVHAKLLASEDVNIYTYPDIPNYDNEKAVLVFPSQTAISISQLLEVDTYEKLTPNSPPVLEKGYNNSTLLKSIIPSSNIYKKTNQHKTLPIDKVIFIDSTWNQSKGIYKDNRINKIPCVVIQNRISQFWRHQKGSPRWYLATIEAVHQFLIEIHINFWGLNPNYKGINNCFTEKTLCSFKNFYNDDPVAYNGQYDNLLFFFHYMYELIHSYYDHEDLFAYKRRLL